MLVINPNYALFLKYNLLSTKPSTIQSTSFSEKLILAFKEGHGISEGKPESPRNTILEPLFQAKRALSHRVISPIHALFAFRDVCP
jgi:hypothetical protein